MYQLPVLLQGPAVSSGEGFVAFSEAAFLNGLASLQTAISNSWLISGIIGAEYARAIPEEVGPFYADRSFACEFFGGTNFPLRADMERTTRAQRGVKAK
jgi:hypothetical protein